MHSPVLPILLCCVIINLLLMHIPSSLGAGDSRYEVCSKPTLMCSSYNLSYPFWGDGRPDFCGHPSFKLHCNGDDALITILSNTYRVNEIKDSSHILRVVREDLLNYSCQRILPNTTMDFNHFSYVSYQRLSLYLYFGCSENSTWPMARKLDCGWARSNRTIFSVIGNASVPQPSNSCETSIVVPVDQGIATQISNSVPEFDAMPVMAAGFELRWMANNTLCDFCIQSGGLCGHDPYSKSFACHCADRTYNNTCGDGESVSDFADSGTRLSIPSKIAIGVSTGMAIIIALSIATIYFKTELCWKKEEAKNQHIDDFFRNYGSIAPKECSYSEIKRITNFFTDKLGQGGYGSVYKGKLCDGRLVAVKVLSETKGNGEEFLNEVASISRTSHVNVVNLLGFCYKRNKRALIYEFMPNGSLDKFICMGESQDADCRLQWKVLYQIAVGTARGLEYLHQGCNTRIVHFDIKPPNILLDKDFCPKISDFGLAKLCKKKESILSTMGARGTVGYIAPEVFFRGLGGISHKSDVYSYGMMVIEMVGLKGKIQVETEKISETYFPNWIYERLELEQDLGFEGVTNAEDEEAARKMLLVGLWCIQTKPSDRPSMSKVVEMLEGSIQSMQTPPKPNLLDSPAAVRSFQESSAASLSEASLS